MIWVDAHADSVDPRFMVRDNYNYHGMPVCHLLGLIKMKGFEEWMRYLPVENLVFIGIRDL